MTTFTKTFKWKIDNYLQWEKGIPNSVPRQSQEFVLPLQFSSDITDPTIFTLKLYPNGENYEYRDYLSFYLHHKKGEAVMIRNSYLYLTDKDQYKKRLEKSIISRKNRSIGFSSFFHKSEIANNQSTYLEWNGALILGCKITVSLGIRKDYSKLNDNLTTAKTSATIFEDHFDTTKPENLENYNALANFQIVCPDMKEGCGKSKKTFNCHKIMLAMGSPVFKAMLSHNSKEATTNRAEIKDISSNTIRNMLHFIYTGNVTENMIDIDLMIAADKYQISKLKALCEIGLCDKLTLESSFDIAKAANLYGTNEFKNVTFQYISDNWQDLDEHAKTDMMKDCPELFSKIVEKFTKSNTS